MTRRGVAGLLASALVLVAVSVEAAPEPTAQATMDEAKRLYSEGHAKFLAGRCDEALPLLTQSNKIVPSPNSGLLIARCLLDRNHPVEAYEKFAEVEQAALEAVRQGETRYGETAAAAAKEKNAVRTKLAVIDLTTRGDRAVTATVDAKPIALGPTGEATVVHEPGRAKVVFTKGTYEDSHDVVVEAGKEIAVAFVAPIEPAAKAPPLPPAPSTSPDRSSGGVPWYGFVTGGLAVAGLGTFVGFGIASESTYGDLDARCAPKCTASDRDEADHGRTYQTVANVGLVAGLVFAAATALVVLVR